jgi:hypothetical protein
MDIVDYGNCNLLELPSLHVLPLQGILLERNNITSLENLPASLKYINARYNRLDADGILHIFPLLQKLVLDHNYISLYDRDDFGGSYPNVKELNLSHNRIKYLGWLHNTRVEDLNLSSNPLSLLSNLPSSLKTLKAEGCRISMIQSKLPQNTESVFLCRNNLRYAGLPLSWGLCLKELHLDSNTIDRFPRKLPDTLTVLTLCNNHIDSLPSTLPSSLQDLIIQSNRLRSFPVYKRKFRVLLLDDNNLIEIPDSSIATVFSATANWNQEIHHSCQKKIQRCWKRYVFTLRLRHFRRVNMVREELYIVSMMPERWEQVDTIDPIWFRKDPNRNRIHHH